MKRSAGEEGNGAHVFLACIMHATGVLAGGGAGRGASSRVAAALDEDAQERASREILERHAPSHGVEVLRSVYGFVFPAEHSSFVYSS